MYTHNVNSTQSDQRETYFEVKKITNDLSNLVGEKKAKSIALNLRTSNAAHNENGEFSPKRFLEIYQQKYNQISAKLQAKKQQPKITRIDVKKFTGKEKLTIKKFGHGWNCRSQPVKIYESDKMSIEEIEQWLIENGWIIYKWEACKYLGIPQGLRAFLPDENGNINSVRTKYQMKKYRGELEKKIREYMQKPESFDKPLPDIMARIHVIDLAKEL